MKISIRRCMAFTLVELLVVIVIIVILASILLPALSTAKKTALGIKCKNSQRNYYLAAQNYVQDFDGFMMPARYPSSIGDCTWDRLFDEYPEYIGAKTTLAARKKVTSLSCPINPSVFKYVGPSSPQYYNNIFRNGLLSYHQGSSSPQYHKISELLDPSGTFEFFDGNYPPGPGFISLWALYYDNAISFYIAYIHANKANFIYTDGHVKNLRLSEVSKNMLTLEKD